MQNGQIDIVFVFVIVGPIMVYLIADWLQKRHTKRMWEEAQKKPLIMESIRRWVEDDIPPPGMN